MSPTRNNKRKATAAGEEPAEAVCVKKPRAAQSQEEADREYYKQCELTLKRRAEERAEKQNVCRRESESPGVVLHQSQSQLDIFSSSPIYPDNMEDIEPVDSENEVGGQHGRHRIVADDNNNRDGGGYVAAMAQLLDVKLAKVATKDDVTEMRMEIKANAGEIDGLKKAIRMIERRIDDPNNMDVPRGEKEGLGWCGEGDFIMRAKNAEQETARRKKYDKARRSLRVWPITGTDDGSLRQNLVDFLENALLLSKREIDEMGIESRAD